MRARDELINPALDWLADMDAPTFKRWFAGSPVERTRRKRLQRNVAIAMGNSGEKRFLPQLERWAAGDDPILAESARWSIEKLDKPAEVNEEGGVTVQLGMASGASASIGVSRGVPAA